MLKIFETQDGSSSLYSEEMGVSYHSKYGAVQESRHVFIEAGLFYKSIAQKALKILEMGFGTGLNVFLTFLEARRLGLSIEYAAIDNFAVPGDLVQNLNYPAVVGQENCTSFYHQIHESAWGERQAISPFFFLTKIQLPFADLSLPPDFDLIYFDAFAPNVQPDLWDLPMTQKMYDALKPGGILVTYCAKGAYKRTLKAVGFEVESLQGPPGKREMTRAIKS